MSADERAAMLAGLGDGDVPAFLLDEKVDFRMELDVWKDQAPHLKRMNALQKPDRYTFAIYCVHMADWIRATLDIRKNGATYKARSTITKDVLHKLNPMVRVRNDAERAILDLATRFGLDPLSRFKLVGIQAGLVGQGMLPGLLEGDGAQKRRRRTPTRGRRTADRHADAKRSAAAARELMHGCADRAAAGLG
jgi:P27 family predicted phage terminase small subunit